MSWSKDGPVGSGSWRPQRPVPMVGGKSDGKGGGGAPGEISTLHVSGFPGDVTDREMECLCRFLPGFVAAKARLQGQPKLWVRFDSPDNAMAAMPLIDGQPFDWREPSVQLWASVSKTDLNPDRMGRPRGPTCMAGCVDELLGLENSGTGTGGDAAWHQWQPEAGKGKGGAGVHRGEAAAHRDGSGIKRPDAGETAGPGWAKRPRTEGEEEIDTIVVYRPAEKGLSDQDIHEFFLMVEGYVALRMGGANCFVKFSDAAAAQNAVASAGCSDLEAAMARNNMNVSQATHFAEAAA